MPVNLDKPQLWKADVARSVDFYNQWFLRFAPQTYRDTRVRVTTDVEQMLHRTDNLRRITPSEMRDHPGILFSLRMSTAPPIARDRLVGLAGVSKSLVETMEKDNSLPPRMSAARLNTDLQKIADMILRLADVDIFPWLTTSTTPTNDEVYRAATIVADRLCGAQADPIVRNAQEQRQLQVIKDWLESRGYTDVTGTVAFADLQPGMFARRMNVVGQREGHESVNIPIDTVIMPLTAILPTLPLMIEAKSAGDFTNVNKRRKEEATKIAQLRRKHGPTVQFILVLCGYFDSGYLGYEASEGIDWVWEHRIDDLAGFGL
jgi:hypothetical protein